MFTEKNHRFELNIQKLGKINNSFFVKDTDNYFEVDVYPENCVNICNLKDLDEVEARNKSYVATNDKEFVVDIAGLRSPPRPARQRE